MLMFMVTDSLCVVAVAHGYLNCEVLSIFLSVYQQLDIINTLL